MTILILCVAEYNDQELWTAVRKLRAAKHEVVVTSKWKVVRGEESGKRHKVDIPFASVDISDYSGLVCVSGNPVLVRGYWVDQEVQDFIHEVPKDMPVAAICSSVPVLGSLLKGKTVSAFPTIAAKQLLKSLGATWQNVSVTVDENVITAEYPMASQLWMEAYVTLLSGGQPEVGLTNSGFSPGGRERKPIPAIENLKKGILDKGLEGLV